jgi:glycosyltransferase involved in cell wall biosynthesis
MPKISVIVCTIRPNTLPHAVQSIRAQTYSDWELLVVDQSGASDTADYLESLRDPRIKHVAQEVRGASNARNGGIHAASTDLLAYMDDDCEAEPDWLAEIWDLMQHQEVDILCGPLVPPPTYRPGLEFCPAYPVPQMEVYTWDAVARDIGTGLSANMVLRRSTVETLGTFDTVLGAGSTRIPSGEETDYVLRALAHGLRVISAPTPPVHHTFGVRPGAEGKRLEDVGNFGVGAVHAKQLLAPYGAVARPYLDQLYRYLRRHVLVNVLRGRRRHLGIRRLQALLKGRAYVRHHFQVDTNALLVSRSLQACVSAQKSGTPI